MRITRAEFSLLSRCLLLLGYSIGLRLELSRAYIQLHLPVGQPDDGSPFSKNSMYNLNRKTIE